MDHRPVYLDFNATTPIDPRVAEAMLPYLHAHFGNPSSSHAYGRRAREAVERARAQVASLLGCEPDEIVFTSGGTESNNAVIKGMAALGGQGGHIVTSAVEHPAVLEPCEALERAGCRVTVLSVDECGLVDPASVAPAITPETILITIMHANNEVGTIQPIGEIGAIARRHGVRFHTDAAQSVGKIAACVDELGVDYLSLAGHKLYAPKGVGALYVRRGRELPKLLHGASHEANRRAGTENVLGIVGLGEAAEIAERELAGTRAHLETLRERLWEGLRRTVDDIRLNGHPERRLPNTLSLGIRGIDATSLISEISERVAASAGAACHGHGVEVSTVLQAMRVPVDYAMGTIRLSVGKTTTAPETDVAIEVLSETVRRLRS